MKAQMLSRILLKWSASQHFLKDFIEIIIQKRIQTVFLGKKTEYKISITNGELKNFDNFT